MPATFSASTAPSMLFAPRALHTLHVLGVLRVLGGEIPLPSPLKEQGTVF
jgi:hypothetical protein